MAYSKTFSDIARSEFQSIYDGMSSSDNLWVRVGNNSSSAITNSNTACTQSTNKSSLPTYTYQSLYKFSKADCEQMLSNVPGDITREVTNDLTDLIDDSGSMLKFDLFPGLPPEDDEDT